MASDESALLAAVGATLSSFQAPLFTTLSSTGWDDFAPRWEHYLASAPTPLSLKQCVSYKVAALLDFQLPDDLTWASDKCTDAVIKNLILDYISPRSRVDALDQFRQLQFQSSGSLVDAITRYCMVYNNLHKRLPQSVMPDIVDIRVTFFERLPDSLSGLQTFLKYERHTSFKRLCKDAIEWCQKAQGLRLINLESSHTNEPSRGTDSEMDNDSSSTSSSPSSSKSEPNANRHSHLVCHYCHAPGHISPNCDKKKQDAASSTQTFTGYNLRPRQSVNAIQPSPAPVSDPLQSNAIQCFDSVCHTPVRKSDSAAPTIVPQVTGSNSDPELAPCSSQPIMNPPMLTVAVQNSITTQALLDSGSQISLIDRDTLKSLPRDSYSTRQVQPRHMRVANGTTHDALTTEVDLQLRFQIGSKVTSVQTSLFVVSHLSVPIILSHGWISLNRLSYLLDSDSPLHLQSPPSVADIAVAPPFTSGSSPPQRHVHDHSI